MKLVPWLVLICLSLVSCSGSKSSNKVEEQTPQIELSDADEFIENTENTENIESPETSVDQPAGETASDASSGAVESTPTAPEELVTSNEPLVQESTLENAVTPTTSAPGAVKQYTVQKNETLMMVAFKLYGDYGRWKEIAGQNREALKGSTNLRAGMTLNYVAPAEEFVWNPQGNPYLIRTGDTLGGISKQVYATIKKWKIIWENNKPLIKDPNKIYAGFTIYYPESGREVATQM
jgi:nucleoid-associated protein YgaU